MKTCIHIFWLFLLSNRAYSQDTVHYKAQGAGYYYEINSGEKKSSPLKFANKNASIIYEKNPDDEYGFGYGIVYHTDGGICPSYLEFVKRINSKEFGEINLFKYVAPYEGGPKYFQYDYVYARFNNENFEIIAEYPTYPEGKIIMYFENLEQVE